MAGGVRITGQDKLRLLGQTMIRQEGIGKKEIRAALRQGTKPGIKRARARARSTLPRRGGLAAEVGRSRITTTIKETGRNVGIRISTKSHDPRIDQGAVRHPTFGHRDRIVEQKVPAGWFTGAMREVAPEMEGALLATMRLYTARLRAKIR